MITPASPWIGSRRTATVSSSIAASTAAASPYGTRTKPGVNGPNPVVDPGSSEKETIEIVRPWKLPDMTTTFARPSGTPFTSWPHLRAIFRAVSTASAPVFIGRIASIPHSSESSAAKVPRRSLWNARLVSVSRPSCRSAASMRRGWRCPKLSAL
jgi:hypothetical protein